MELLSEPKANEERPFTHLGRGGAVPAGPSVVAQEGEDLLLTKVFTLRFDPIVDGFDDTQVRDFTKDRQVISVKDHFFLRHEVPYLTLVITYLAGRKDAPGQSSDNSGKPDD